jgi:phenylalanine-4-hydroxylase
MIMKQDMNAYTAEDQKVWKTLFDRQLINLQNKSCEEYLTCLNAMQPVLNSTQIPNFNQITEWFKTKTEWQIEVVPGIIPVDEFFKLLAEKKFCSSTWLRSWKQLDYLEEPDMFHDVFGHIPLLANAVFSDFACEFGKLGVKAIGNEQLLIELQRLYWFTIEFGLINSEKGMRIYGAGLMSSFGESTSSLGNDIHVLPFDIDKILNQPFKNDEPQSLYFAINDLQQLFDSIQTLKTTVYELEK